jgi:cytochrome c553
VRLPTWVLAAGLCLAAGTPCHAQDAERGRVLAETRQCATCHGADGISTLPGTPSIAGQHTDFTTLHLVLFREGIRKVPAMQAAAQGLSDAQIEDLSAHFARLPPAPPPDRGPADPARIAEGQRLSAAMNCGTCHLPTYAGRANIPRIAGQREDFLARTLRDYRDNIRVGADTQMNGAMYGVTDAQIAALAHFMAQH